MPARWLYDECRPTLVVRAQVTIRVSMAKLMVITVVSRNIRLAAVAALLLANPLPAQQRRLRPNVVQFVSVNAPVVALVNVRVVDGTGAPARNNQTIVLRGGEIVEVGSTAAVRPPADARVIDLQGHTVIPGLVNLHEHTWFGGMRRSTHMATSGPLLACTARR